MSESALTAAEMRRRNPFLRIDPEEASPNSEDLDLPDLPEAKGPSRPDVAPDVNVAGDAPWPVTELVDGPAVCVLGLHGGAGATTLTRLLGDGALDVEQAWPVYAGWARPRPFVPVVAVARTHYCGIQAAGRFARLWAANTLPSSTLLGLVLVDDAPRISRQQQTQIKRVQHMTPRGWHVPWQEAWRIEAPSPDSLPRQVRHLISRINRLAQSPNGDKK